MALDWINRLGPAFYAGYRAVTAVFRKQALRSFPALSTACDHSDDYGLWDYRQIRYELFWALYENTAYDNIHLWAAQYKTDYGLYRHTRGVYNPAYRLGEFWATHLMGGSLDPAAGDGKLVPSALPIETRNEALRKPIARVFRDSNWQINKTLLCRLGAVLGDVALKVYDDLEEGRVILEVVHPASLPWVSKDTRGNIRGYCFQERRPNPEFDPMQPINLANNREFSTYTEYCVRTPDGARFWTLRDNRPYQWPGNEGVEWTAPYPFVPMVFIQHIKVDPNEAFGLSELFAGHTKINETSDMGSNMHDQIRKVVRGAWFVTGVPAPRDGSNPFAAARKSTTANPEPERTDVPVIYGGSGATAQSLVNSLQLQETSQEIQNQLRELEIDYPELYHLRALVSGDASALARREARKPAEAKVYERRAVYDDAMVRALKMAVAIGGYRGYAEYEGFDFESYNRGDLDFRIGARPVFSVDIFDDLERERQRWTNAGLAVSAQYPLRQWLLDSGYTDDQIAAYDAEVKRQMDQGIDQQAQLMEAKAEAEMKAKADAQAQAQADAMARAGAVGLEGPPVGTNGVAA